MSGNTYEWDAQKAAENLAKHGITFAMARDVFRDPFALDFLDERTLATEDRFITIGMVENRLLFVAYTLRGDTVRIISARLAEPFERRRYHDANQA